MRKRKLLVVSQLPVWDIEKNSGKAVMEKTFKAFSKKYDLTIIAPGAERIYNKSKFYAISNKFHDQTKNIKYIGHFLNYIYFINFYLQVKKLVKKREFSPDIIYTVGYFGSYTASKIFKNRFIVNRYYGVAWDEVKFNTVKEKIRLYLKKMSFKHFGDLIVMTNDGTKGKLFLEKIGCNKEKILFLKNGIEMEYDLQPGFKNTFLNNNNLHKESILFLTVSRLAKWKKVERAIILIAKLKNNFRYIKLLIVGEGEERENLKKLSRNLNVEENVIFVGSITHKELPNYYNIADVFLSLYDYSNAGNPLFEAMLHKKKIITIGNGDTRSFIDPNAAVILDNYSEEELYKKTKKMLLNKENQLNMMSNNAYKQFKENFLNWEDRIKLEINEIENSYLSKQK